MLMVKFQLLVQKLEVFRVTDSPGLNKVLTDSDGSGTAVWTDVSSGADNDWVIVNPKLYI